MRKNLKNEIGDEVLIIVKGAKHYGEIATITDIDDYGNLHIIDVGEGQNYCLKDSDFINIRKFVQERLYPSKPWWKRLGFTNEILVLCGFILTVILHSFGIPGLASWIFINTLAAGWAYFTFIQKNTFVKYLYPMLIFIEVFGAICR